MHAPRIGRIECRNGYGCARCGLHADANILTNIAHDLRCWSVRTALYNAYIRLTVPDWFI